MIATAAAEPKPDNVEKLAFSLLPFNKSGKQQTRIGDYDFRFRGHNDRGYGIKIYVDSADNTHMLAHDRKWCMFDVSKEDGRNSYVLCVTKTAEAPLLHIDASTDVGEIVRHVAAACIKYVQQHKMVEAAAEPGTSDVFTALLDKLHSQAPAKAYLGNASVHATGIHSGPFKDTIFIDILSKSEAPRRYELTLRHRYGDVYLIQVVSEFDAKKQIKVKASDHSELVSNIAKALGSSDTAEAAAEPGHGGHLRGDFPGLAFVSVPERNGKQFETELRRACKGTVNIDAAHTVGSTSLFSIYSRQRSDVEFKNYVKTLLAVATKLDATLILGRGDRYQLDATKPRENTEKLTEIAKLISDAGHDELQQHPHDFPALQYGHVEAAAEPNPGDDIIRIFKALEQKLPRTDPDKALKEFKPVRVQGLNFVVLSHESDNTIRFHILDNIYHACGFAEIPFSFNNDPKNRCVRLELQGRSGMEHHDIKHAIDTSDLLRQMLVWFATTYKSRSAASKAHAAAEPAADAYADLLRRISYSKDSQVVMRSGDRVVEGSLITGRPGIFLTVSSKDWPADWYAPLELLKDERGRVHVWKQIRSGRRCVSTDLLAGKPDLKTFTQLLFKAAVRAGDDARKVYEEEREHLSHLRDAKTVNAAAEPIRTDFNIEDVTQAFMRKSGDVTKILTFKTSDGREVYLSLADTDNTNRKFWEIRFDVFGAEAGSEDDAVDLDYVVLHVYKDRSGFEIGRHYGNVGGDAKTQRLPWSDHLNGRPDVALLFLVKAIRSWVVSSRYIKVLSRLWTDAATTFVSTTGAAEPDPAPGLARLRKQAMDWLRDHTTVTVSGTSVNLRARPGMNPNKHTVDFWMTRSADHDAVVNSRALDCSVSWKARGDKIELTLWRKFYTEAQGVPAAQAESKHVIHISGFTVDKFMKSVIAALLKTDEGAGLLAGDVGSPATAAVEPKDTRPETLVNQLLVLRSARRTIRTSPHVFLNKIPSVRRNVFAAPVTSQREICEATFEATISLDPDQDTAATRYVFSPELWFLLTRKKSLVLTSVRCEPFMRRVVNEKTFNIDVTGKTAEYTVHVMALEVARYIRDNLAGIVEFIAHEKAENNWDETAEAWAAFAQRLKAGKS